jgi:hypothetical protein
LRRKSDQLDNLAIGTERFTATTADATDKYSRQSGDTSMRGDPHLEQMNRRALVMPRKASRAQAYHFEAHGRRP